MELGTEVVQNRTLPNGKLRANSKGRGDSAFSRRLGWPHGLDCAGYGAGLHSTPSSMLTYFL